MEELVARSHENIGDLVKTAYRNLDNCDQLHKVLDERTNEVIVFNGEEERFLDSALKPLAFNSRFDSQMVKLDDESHKEAIFYKLDDSSCLPEGHKRHNLLSYYSYNSFEPVTRTPYDSV